MLIGGLQACSFIDFPGQLAAVVFVQGCNLRCAYCHNPELVGPRTRTAVPAEVVLELLLRRRGRLGGVVITGGEPTLQPGLPRFVQRVRDLGYRVKLDTNGTRPPVLADLLDAGLLDYVAMDLKDPPDGSAALLGRRVPSERISSSVDAIIGSGVDHEFRTTVCVPHHDRERLLAIGEHLRGARRWYLQPFRPGRTLAPDAGLRPPDPGELEAVAAELRARGLPCRCR